MKSSNMYALLLVLLGSASLALANDVYEDMNLSVPELIVKYGYPFEQHTVRTEDGYLLGVHRIPGSSRSPPAPGKPVVIVMHGMLSSSAEFVIMGPNNGLAYMLADEGYDVWMGNCRGNRYSTEHIALFPDTREFWDFTWHEIGMFDLPAIIDYARGQTGQNRVHYIGHSQGTTAFWVMTSMRPSYNTRIIAMQALAPAAYMHNTRSPYVIFLSMFLNTMDLAMQMMGTWQFEPTNEMDRQAGYDQCRDGAPDQMMCTNSLFLMAGYNSQELNFTMLPVIMGHSPAGAAAKQMIHFGQVTRAQRFRQYDYGALNLQIHGQLTPPLYDLSRISTPIYMYHSTNDWMATPEDVALLHAELPNVALKYLVSMPEFNHMDFVWAINVRTLLYNRVFQSMREAEANL